MVDVSRVRTTWTGKIGLPGVTTMYFLDTDTATGSLATFWMQFIEYIPDGVVIQVENSGDVIDSETGVLTDTWVGEAQGAISCTGTGDYAAPVGAVMNWLTADVVAGHRLRGKSFIVPLVGSKYDSSGTLDNGAKSAIQAYGAGLIAAQSTSFCIWHRGTGTNGSVGLVTECKVPDLVAVLRSRRD